MIDRAPGIWGKHLMGWFLAPVASVGSRLAARRASRRGAILERRDRRLRTLIRHAATQVPYYRHVFAATGIDPDRIESAADLAELPLLDRQTLSRHFEAMIAENIRLAFCGVRQTSGTTGIPLQIVTPLTTQLSRYVQQQRRLAQLGLRRSDFRPLRGNYVYISDTEYRPEFRRSTYRMPIFRLSRSEKFDFRPEFAGEPGQLLRRIHRLRPVYLHGKPSSLLRFADLMDEHDRGGTLRILPKVVVTGAEQLLPVARERLASAFECPVFDSYGITEVGLIGCECTERNGFHVEDDEVIVEIVRNGKPAPQGQLGEIVVTSLSNRAMPLIRYRTGDIGRLSLMPCACGLAYPRLTHLQGRIVDQFITPQGTYLNPFVLLGDLPRLGLDQYQLVQRSSDLVVVRYVGDQTPERVCRAIADKVSATMGDVVEVRAERVAEIDLPGRKVKLYVNELMNPRPGKGSDEDGADPAPPPGPEG